MNKKTQFAFILAFLILNYSALDDITTGSEPNYYFEWMTVIFSAILLAVYVKRRLLREKNLQEGRYDPESL